MPKRLLFACVLLACSLAGALGSRAEELVVLARPGPWTAVSGLVGYGERLWFVNAELFVNHNSADVYSYDPRTGRARYEAHLFSQNAGLPAVAEGLLYWPFEDARSSAGRGEFMVTDGRDWAWHLLPERQVFHIHAMLGHRGTLFAATSAWRGGLQRSDDGGHSWRLLYEYPSPPRTVNRFTELARLGDEVFAALTAWREEGVKLFRLSAEGAAPIEAWPPGRATTGVTPYRDRLYGINHTAGGSRVWRTNGKAAEPIAAFDGLRVRGFAAAPERLYAITNRRGGGTLWSSANGLDWGQEFAFTSAEPADVAIHGGRVYVGTIGPDGGALWGPSAPAPAGPPVAPPALPSPWHPLAEIDPALAALDRALEGSLTGHGDALRRALRPLARHGSRAAGTALATRLQAPPDETPIALFGGALRVTATTFKSWYLLWSLAFNGHGRVAPEWLAAPWTLPANRAEKYLEAGPMAMWAAARLGQSDDATLQPLVSTLGRPGDPGWLDGDRIGALTAITGQRFGYDLAAWRAWWAARSAL